MRSSRPYQPVPEDTSLTTKFFLGEQMGEGKGTGPPCFPPLSPPMISRLFDLSFAVSSGITDTFVTLVLLRLKQLE